MTKMPDTSINLPISPGGELLQINSGDLNGHQDGSALLAAVSGYIEGHGGGQGLFETPVSGVRIIRSFQEIMPVHRIYQPSLCVVVQGAKQILFGDDVLGYGTMECLVVSIELPASGRIVKASATEPFMGVTIDFDVAMVREVAEQLRTKPIADADSGPCVFVGQVDGPLADCILRLIKMADTPKAIPILHPSVMREICYWLLSGPHGGEISKLTLPETHADRISKAIYFLRDHFTQTLRVEQLADISRMSTSSFHQHFKAMTSMTPLQYQKQLRLIEARRLMVAESVTVSEVAFQVGYESASQFSREYSRVFGAAPKRDVARLKAMATRYNVS